MSEINIFEYATANKLRFHLNGNLTVEDLWDLGLDDLDALYKSMVRAKTDSVQGLIERRPTKLEKENEIRLAIVEHIFGVKKEAAEARKSAAERKAAKDRLKGILAEKLDSADREKSIDDLKKMIEELG